MFFNQPPTHVPRTWENLPSMAMVPLPHKFDYSVVIRMICAEAADKELINLVDRGWSISQDMASRQIELTWNFADDPKLVVMRFPMDGQIIVRSSFMMATASQIDASTIPDLADQLSALAKAKGLHVMSGEEINR